MFLLYERLMPHSQPLPFFPFLQPSVGKCYAVIGSHLFHSNLSMLYRNVFFKMCKVHGIGFNKKVSLIMCIIYAVTDLTGQCDVWRVNPDNIGADQLCLKLH